MATGVTLRGDDEHTGAGAEREGRRRPVDAGLAAEEHRAERVRLAVGDLVDRQRHRTAGGERPPRRGERAVRGDCPHADAGPKATEEHVDTARAHALRDDVELAMPRERRGAELPVARVRGEKHDRPGNGELRTERVVEHDGVDHGCRIPTREPEKLDDAVAQAPVHRHRRCRRLGNAGARDGALDLAPANPQDGARKAGEPEPERVSRPAGEMRDEPREDAKERVDQKPAGRRGG